MITLPTQDSTDRRNHRRSKECIESRLLISHDNGQFRISLKAQWFKSYRADGAAPLYCTVQYWSNDTTTIYTESNAQASGFGYDKQGATFGNALINAGFILPDKAICYGGGDIRQTIEATAKALNLNHYMILSV